MAADLALVADPDAIERSADPAAFVVQACQRAKAWLTEALEHGEIEQIAEIKSQAEAVRAYTTQKQLGKDAQLAATEIVRRAERGIGVAIRRGQEAGQIRRMGQSPGNQYTTGVVVDNNSSTPRPVTDFATRDELSGNGAGIYHLADDVSDEQFEEAVNEAKAEGNLSRANVVRKIRHWRSSPPAAGVQVPDPADGSAEAVARRRDLIGEFAASGMSSVQISERLGLGDDWVRQVARERGIAIRADAVLGRTRRPDSNRIVQQTAHALEGLAMGVALADPAELDPGEASEWATSMIRSIRQLSKFARQMKEAVQ
jgi:hypothetical protein